MAYIGTIKERMNMVVTLVSEYAYCTRFGYTEQVNYIYKFKDDEDNEIVWKTAKVIGKETENRFEAVIKGDRIKIKATIKAHSIYRDNEQTVITRVKVLDIIEKAFTQEEKDEIKQAEQLETLTGEDFIYTMPYRQYKEHYADCELLAGSWNEQERTVGVIVREGRLKNSGVRGRQFADYMFKNGERCRCIYAVSEENAWKRLEKEMDDFEDWHLDFIRPSGTPRW